MTTFMARTASGVDGEFLAGLAARVQAADPGRRLEVTNVMTGEILGDVPRCSPTDVLAAAGRALAVQSGWAATPVAEPA